MKARGRSMVASEGLTGSTIRPVKQKGGRSKSFEVPRRAIAAAAIFLVIGVLSITFVPTEPSSATPTREGSCGCHPTGADTLLVVSGLPTQYDPGQTYTIIVTVDDLNGATGENSFSLDVSAGTILQSQTDPNVEYNSATRASANDSVSPMSTATWSVLWTAPASGDVTITVNAVSANDVDTGQNSPTDSDQIVLTANSIPEFPTILVPILAIVGVILLAARASKK